ncbi:MAG: DNA-deoxyinosine glycosylase [Ruminococcaceae bacterium]|nr:DNA-deoxyinosine glycosylase [Oscillospiraceae bacterium]
MTRQRKEHGIPPVYDENSKILILGSFPSVASRAEGFFYGHPRNRFWRVLAAVFDERVPTTVGEKKSLLLRNKVALFDVLAACEIEGSSDSSIMGAIPNDLTPILVGSQIARIFVNGKTAERLYDKYLKEKTGLSATVLPSTSPANAAWSEERLVAAWQEIKRR